MLGAFVCLLLPWANELTWQRERDEDRYFAFWQTFNTANNRVWSTKPRESAPFAWMSPTNIFRQHDSSPSSHSVGSFAQLLDGLQLTSISQPTNGNAPRGLYRDPDRWRYRVDNRDQLYRLVTRIEVPNPSSFTAPNTGRDWYAEERLHIPVPLTLPVADQLFMFGQFYGSGDSLNNQQTSINGKTGVGMKWSVEGTDLQLRYATIFAYADMYRTTRFSERTLPALEILANRSLIGPLQIEYMGSAIPAVTPVDRDQFRQELRFALPFKGENEVEFGARYRYEYGPGALPWVDRAQLFFGIKLRH